MGRRSTKVTVPHLDKKIILKQMKDSKKRIELEYNRGICIKLAENLNLAFAWGTHPIDSTLWSALYNHFLTLGRNGKAEEVEISLDRLKQTLWHLFNEDRDAVLDGKVEKNERKLSSSWR